MPAAVSWQLVAVLVAVAAHDVAELVAELNAVAKQTFAALPAEPFVAYSAVDDYLIAVFAKLLPEQNLAMEGQQEEEDLALLEMHGSNPTSYLLLLDSSLLPKWSMQHWLNTAFALPQEFPAPAKGTKPLQV